MELTQIAFILLVIYALWNVGYSISVGYYLQDNNTSTGWRDANKYLSWITLGVGTIVVIASAVLWKKGSTS